MSLLKNIKKIVFPNSSVTQINRGVIKVTPNVKALSDIEWKDSDDNVLTSQNRKEKSQNNSIIIWDSTNKKFKGIPITSSEALNPLTLDSTNNKIGINTSSPDAQLTVSGGEGESGSINIWADDGDDNADKWRLIAVNGGNLELQSYSSGSWVVLASYRVDGRLGGGCIKDEDDMASNSASHIASQQSIKAYVDYTRYIRHIMNVGWNASNANKDYLPLTGYISERDSASSSNEYIAFVAPYDGLLDKVVVRSEEACGSSVVGFHKSDEGTEVPSSTATEEITVDMTTDDTGYTFTFTGTASFDKGDIITISFDPTNTPYDTVATIVWKFDTST